MALPVRGVKGFIHAGMTFVTSQRCFLLKLAAGIVILSPNAVGRSIVRTPRIISKRILLGCLILLGGLLRSGAAQSGDAQESKLLVLEHMWNEAQVQRDAHALEGMIADHFINTEYDGEVSDRQKFLADIADPQYQPSSMTLHDVKVTLYKDTAVIAGVYHAKGMFNGKPYDHNGRFTDTWVLDSGRWLCVASHTSLLKK